MSESLGNKTLKGVSWSALERFSFQGITFIIQLVLARLLTPSDYGVIAMLSIFLQLAQVLIDCGFGNALIKKQDCTDVDFSTVFFFNLGISLLIYFILFFLSPFISRFYDTPLLTPVLRVLALTLLFNAVSIVQQTILVKKVDFRSQSIVTLSSAIISGAVGILCAYKGYGPWALVFQQLLNSILRSIFYLAIVRWIPKVTFSVSSFSYVFNFGSKLLLSTFIDVIYKNLYKIVIGKKYSDADLGYYTKAEEFAMFPSSNVANIISRVCLPIMSKIQDDNERLLNVYRSLIRYTSFLIFPLMIGLLAVSRPFIITFLKDAWEPAVLILRILCLDWMLDFISVLNLNLLLVKGRTDLVLKLQVIKKIIAVAILFATVPFGIEVMCWGKFLYAIIAVIINTYYTKQLIGLRLLSQMCDILPFLIVSIVMGVSSYIMTIQFNNSITSLFAGIVTGIVMYLIMSLVFFKKDINALFVIIRKRNE